MKKLFIALCLTVSVSAMAQIPVVGANTTFTASGMAVPGATANSYAIISGKSKSEGAPVVTLLSATSDLTTSIVQFYATTNLTYQVGTLVSGNTLTVANTNGLNPLYPIIIQHASGLPDEIVFPSAMLAVGSSWQVALGSAAANTAAGDLIYYTYPNGQIPVGSATITANSVGVFSGQRRRPLLAIVNGTSTSKINTLTAKYVP